MQLQSIAARLGSTAGLFFVLVLTSQAGNTQFVTAETFDIDRYLPTGDRFQFETFYVDETQSLQSALDAGIVAENTDTARKYYPVPAVREHGGAVVDELDGRRLLVYLDPLTSTPAAIYVDEVSAAEWDGRVLRLDNGQTVRAGQLLDAAHLDAAHEPQPGERPLQDLHALVRLCVHVPRCKDLW